MSETALAFMTPTDAVGWKRWLLYSPLARIAIYAALYIGMSMVFGVVAAVLRMRGFRFVGLPGTLALLGLEMLPALLAYLVLVRLIEQRRVSELRARDMPRQGGVGLLGGIVLFSTVVAVLSLAGSYHVTGFNPHAHWTHAALVVGAGAGIGEEIVSRGVLFRIVEEGLGTWAAIVVSAVFFGGMHFANPAATWWSCASIAVEGGLLLAMTYHLTRTLWPCIGVHAGWNFAQGTIYGIPVSGARADGWLVSSRSGPTWLSGGAFGAEASVVALVTCGLVTTVMLAIALRRRSIVAPAWLRRRGQRMAAPGTLPSDATSNLVADEPARAG